MLNWRRLPTAVSVIVALFAIVVGLVLSMTNEADAQTPTPYPSPSVSPSASVSPTAPATATATATATRTATPTATATTAAPTCSAIAGASTLTLTPAEEVPPTTTDVTATLSYRLDGTVLSWRLQAAGTGITMAHFHVGAKGTNGPVVFFLFGPSPAGVSSFDTCGTVTGTGLSGSLAGNVTEFVNQLRAGNIYANVHTLALPAGAVRAQLPASVAPTAPATGLAAGGGDDVPVYLLLAGAAVLLGGSTAAFALRRRRATGL